MARGLAVGDIFLYDDGEKVAFGKRCRMNITLAQVIVWLIVGAL